MDCVCRLGLVAMGLLIVGVTIVHCWLGFFCWLVVFDLIGFVVGSFLFVGGLFVIYVVRSMC